MSDDGYIPFERKPLQIDMRRANCVRDVIQARPYDIRVLCPRGHFIVVAGLRTVGDDASAALRIVPQGSGHGFAIEPLSRRGALRVRMTCTIKRCRYSGSFNHLVIATELAEQAIAGHAEYRLTN